MNRLPHLSITLLLLTLYWALILQISFFAPLDLAIFLFSEQGTFEIFSPFLWFLLAIVCCFSRLKMTTRLATCSAAILLGLREMDLHKSLFGISFLKTGFYRSENFSLSDKLLGASICLLLLALVGYLAYVFLKTRRRMPHPRPIYYHYMMLTLWLLIISKFSDRLNAHLNKLFHLTLSERTAVIIQSLEESTEMILPVLLCIAVFLYPSRAKS